MLLKKNLTACFLLLLLASPLLATEETQSKSRRLNADGDSDSANADNDWEWDGDNDYDLDHDFDDSDSDENCDEATYPGTTTLDDFEARMFSSGRPYCNDLDVTWTIAVDVVATGIEITFGSDNELEEDYDFLLISDGSDTLESLTGDLSNETYSFEGDYFEIRFTSDESINAAGFDIFVVAVSDEDLDEEVEEVSDEDLDHDLDEESDGDFDEDLDEDHDEDHDEDLDEDEDEDSDEDSDDGDMDHDVDGDMDQDVDEQEEDKCQVKGESSQMLYRYDTVELESPHNYCNDTYFVGNYGWIDPAGEYLVIWFSCDSYIERDFDTITIEGDNGQRLVLSGGVGCNEYYMRTDSVTVTFESDYTDNYWGFHMSIWSVSYDPTTNDDVDDTDYYEESHEEVRPRDDLSFEILSPFYINPGVLNTIEVDVDNATENFTWQWSVSPDHFDLTVDDNVATFNGRKDNQDWAPGTYYEFTIQLTGKESGYEYDTSLDFRANDAPTVGDDFYTISPDSGSALSTDFTHTWGTATDMYPAEGSLRYELYRVSDDGARTLMSLASPLTRFHLAGSASNNNIAQFELDVIDDAGAVTTVSKSVTVSPLTDVSEDEKTDLIEGKVDSLLGELSDGDTDVVFTAEEKVKNLGLLDTLSQALVVTPSSDSDSDSDDAVEETQEQIDAKIDVTNKIIGAINDTFDAEDDDVVDAVLGVAQSVSSNTEYLDDGGRDNLLDLFQDASEREGGLTGDMATAAVGGLSNILDSLDSGDDSEEDSDAADNSETYAKVDKIVDNAFEAVFSGDSDTREVVIETENIKATFAKVDPEDVEGTVSAGDNNVEVPSGIAADVPEDSSVLVKVVAKSFNAYEEESDIELGSSIVEFTLKAQSDDDGEITEISVENLTNPIIIDIAISEDSDIEDLECKYWDTTNKEWSTEGLVTISIEDGVMKCSSTHATDFAGGEAVSEEEEEEEEDADDAEDIDYEETEDADTSAAIATLSTAAATLVAMLF